MVSMAITYGELSRLGDRPGVSGPLTKLNDLVGDVSLASTLSVVDRYRISRFVQIVGGELVMYSRLLGEIGRRYGEVTAAPEGFVSFVVRPECRNAYDEEKAKLDAMECEGLQSLKPLPVSAYERVSLTPRDLACLEKFIVPPVCE